MALSELSFSKEWTNSTDFPTYEPDEAQVRADMQLLFDEIRDYINQQLRPDLLGRVPEARKINGKALSADVTLAPADIGLGAVDNTSDLDKPVSTAQQAALDLKADKADVLEKDNTASYTPSAPFHPATKRYVDTVLADATLGTVPDESIGEQKLTPALVEKIDQQMPVGGIIMWSGAASAVPDGWALCDGSNGTPDLRDRFIVGAGGEYTPGSTGGAESIQLTVQDLPPHGHAASGTALAAGEHAHGDTFSTTSSGGHTHSFSSPVYDSGTRDRYVVVSATNSQSDSFYGLSESGDEVGLGSAGSHSHSISGSVLDGGEHTHDLDITVSNTGGGAAHENRPPYYALCFIMRTA